MSFDFTRPFLSDDQLRIVREHSEVMWLRVFRSVYNSKMTEREIAICRALRYLRDNKGSCEPTEAEIVEILSRNSVVLPADMKSGRTTVAKWLDSARQFGVLEVLNGAHPTRFRLCDLKDRRARKYERLVWEIVWEQVKHPYNPSAGKQLCAQLGLPAEIYYNSTTDRYPNC